MKINLTDNSKTEELYDRKEIASLFQIADIPIEKLCEDNANILIFPHSLEDSADKIGELPAISILNTSDSEKVQIATGNIMGFFGIGNLHVKIQSRFDKGRDDYFLHYMLQRVLSFNLFDLNHNNEQEDVFDFVMFMFPYYLKNAMRQGLYSEYQNYRHNDSNVKGPIDLAKHISKNIPFVGNFAYKTREYSHDNPMTQLVRHTIEFMKSKKFGSVILNMDRETVDNVKYIVENTPSYDKSDRSIIISKNLRKKSHPFYTEYSPLQSLCIQILRMEEVKYGEADDEICGILFDGAWLWEEYVNTVLRDLDFIHPENKLGKGAIYLFEDVDENGKIRRSGRRYPDFYKNDFVLDAKYKRLGSYEKVSLVDRDDIHQVITYMNNLNATRGGFVAPLENPQNRIPSAHLKDSAKVLSIYGIEICKDARSYKEFCEKMQVMEEKFKYVLQKY